MFKLALDAGHGKNTPGKRCLKKIDPNETREWMLNARICDYIEKYLSGYQDLEILRVDDASGETDVPLATRTKKANQWGADFYLSVHHDAGLCGKKGGGTSVIAYTSASARSLEYQNLIYKCFIETTGKFGNRSNPMPLQNLHVLRETNMPAILIECGFMDSVDDVPKILSEDFAEKAAQGLVNALVHIGGLTRKKESTVMASKFEDIKGHFAEKDINDLHEMGIVNGKAEDKFMPNEPITRGEVAIIARNVIRYLTGK